MKRNRGDFLGSMAIGLIIIFYGVIGPYVWPHYQDLVVNILPDMLIQKLIPFFNGKEIHDEDVYNLGKYFIYYPSYMILHLGLVSVLFRKSPKSRLIGVFAILGSLSLAALLSLLFFKLKWFAFYNASIGLFKTLVGMPFILFIVEGGRLLDLDLDKLLEAKNKEKS